MLISVDSLRADHLGCYGCQRSTSPAIDRLAAEGVLFEVATSSSSWTLPAHAALFTGLPDSIHGCDRGKRSLASSLRTLAESMQAAGYRTGALWSGPLLHPTFGLDQGFDDYINCTSWGDGPVRKRWQTADAQSHRDITSERVLSAATAWIEAGREHPFFLFVHLWDVHYDFIPPPPYDTMFDPDYQGERDGRNLDKLVGTRAAGLAAEDMDHLRALYDGEIAWTDHHIGRLVEKLDTLGPERTMIVLTSDHGEEFLEHGRFGHKQTLFEESIRIPLIVRQPGRVPAGQRRHTPVQIVDIAPTILEVAGALPLPNILGSSLVPALAQEPAGEAPPAVSELLLDAGTGENLLAIRSAGWKLVHRPAAGVTVGLWRLGDDPAEQENVLMQDRELTMQAMAALQETFARLDQLAALHQVPATSHELPHDLANELKALGYINDDTSARVWAEPNPVQVCDGSLLVAVTVHWQAPQAQSMVEVRIDRPDGQLFATGGREGSAETGVWARDGMVFYLVDSESGTVTAVDALRFTTVGCPPR